MDLAYASKPGATTNDVRARLLIRPKEVESHPRAPRDPQDLGITKKSGYHWSRAKVEVRSTGPRPMEASFVEFALVDSGNRSYKAERLPAYSPALGAEGHPLRPGERTTAFVAFQVRDGARITRLRATSPVSPSPALEWSV